MEDCTDNKPQLMVKYESFKEEENTSNISTDLVVVGNDSSIERKPNIRRQAAVRINEKNDIECLPGYRFNPFDHELLLHYLWRKVRNQPLPHNKIAEIELYKYNPEDITQVEQGLVDKEWYFFTPRDRKYKNGLRPNRAAGNGYWKATGADKDVTYKGVIVGHRKALVFYNGKAPKGDKTNWIMHEFRVKEEQKEPQRIRTGDNDMRLDDWVLCRIYKKDDRTRRAPKQSHADNSFDNSLDESSPSNQNAVATRNDNYETGGDLCYDIGGNNPPLMGQNVVVQNPQLMGVNDLRSITDLRSAIAMNNNAHFTNHYVDTSMHTPYLANPPAYSNPQPLRYIAQSSFPTYSLENLPYLDSSFENWGNTGQYYSPVENSFLNDSPTDPVLVQSNTGHVLQSISRNNLIVSENNSDIITPSNDNSPS